MNIVVPMVLALAMILFGAELFTNAVEWLGRKMRLGQGAVGSVLAALGTALPETAVPVTAIIAGKGSTRSLEIGMGGILGAPFLLITLGSLIMAVSLWAVHRRGAHLRVDAVSYNRDMTVFLLAFALVTTTGCISNHFLHHAVPFVLVALYGLFLYLTLRDRMNIDTESQLHPLYIQGKVDQPRLPLVLLQLALALGLIVGGAHLLTGSVERLADLLNIPTFIVSAVLIPLATELPETLNSVVWIRQGKDALATGNITGAMVFQSTLVPALGIWLTPWNLTNQAILTAGLTLTAAAFAFGMFRLQNAVTSTVLVVTSLLYWMLPLQGLAGRYDLHIVYWIGLAGLGAVLLLTASVGTRFRSL